MALSLKPEPRSSFKTRVKQEREQEILQAARDIFAQHGFEKASIDDIADRVGIGKGTVYLHFGSKEELLLALMRQNCAQMVAGCRARMEGASTAPEKLQAAIRALADHRYANESWVRIVASEMPVFMGFKQRLAASSELRALLVETIQQGQAEGSLDSGVNPLVAATTLLFLVFATPFLAGQKRMSKQELIDTVSRLYFHGISRR
jgi:AcrR family transcriptional regulator